MRKSGFGLIVLWEFVMGRLSASACVAVREDIARTHLWQVWQMMNSLAARDRSQRRGRRWWPIVRGCLSSDHYFWLCNDSLIKLFLKTLKDLMVSRCRSSQNPRWHPGSLIRQITQCRQTGHLRKSIICITYKHENLNWRCSEASRKKLRSCCSSYKPIWYINKWATVIHCELILKTAIARFDNMVWSVGITVWVDQARRFVYHLYSTYSPEMALATDWMHRVGWK